MKERFGTLQKGEAPPQGVADDSPKTGCRVVRAACRTICFDTKANRGIPTRCETTVFALQVRGGRRKSRNGLGVGHPLKGSPGA